MSNASLKSRIKECIDRFRTGDATLDDLISAVESNGSAFANMPYALIKEIDSIEHRLTVAKFADEEDCDGQPAEAVASIETWLSKVPD
jgi:hypothetical protein